MGFSLNAAIAGAAGAVSDVAGDYVKTAIHRDAQISLLQVRAEIDTLRDQRLAELSQGTHRVNAETDLEMAPRKTAAEVAREAALRPGKIETKRAEGDIEVDVAKRKPRTISPGATEKIGDETYTAPIKTPQEQLDYYKASANRLNAEADAIRAGERYRQGGAAAKPQLPNIKVEKDADGNIYNVDQNSGAIGTIIKGTPSVKGETRWFGPNDPDKPETQPQIQWNYNGKVLPNGLSDIYPDIRSRSGSDPAGSGAAPGATPSGRDWGAFFNKPPEGAAPKPAGAKPEPQAPEGIRGLQAQLDFDADAARMKPQELVAKYGSLESELTMPQLQKLVEARKNVPKRALPGLLNSAIAGQR